MSVATTSLRGTTQTVGIAEMHVSTSPDDMLVTYSLGSCIGVTVYDPAVKVGALIHCMLPVSKLDPEKAKARPYMFVDTGVLAMLQGVLDAGAEKSRLIIKAAGAASPMDNCGRFKIGDRNHTTLRKILWKNDLLIKREDIGGTQPRTMTLYLADGRTTIRTGREEADL